MVIMLGKNQHFYFKEYQRCFRKHTMYKGNELLEWMPTTGSRKSVIIFNHRSADVVQYIQSFILLIHSVIGGNYNYFVSFDLSFLFQ